MRDAWRLILIESSGGFFLGLVNSFISYFYQRSVTGNDDDTPRPRLRDYLPAPVFMGTFPAVLATCLYLLIGGHDRQVFTTPLEAWRYTIVPMVVASVVTICLGNALFPHAYAWVERSTIPRWFRGSSPQSPKRYGIYLLIGVIAGLWTGIFVGAFTTARGSLLSLWLVSIASLQWIRVGASASYPNQEAQGE